MAKAYFKIKKQKRANNIVRMQEDRRKMLVGTLVFPGSVMVGDDRHARSLTVNKGQLGLNLAW